MNANTSNLEAELDQAIGVDMEKIRRGDEVAMNGNPLRPASEGSSELERFMASAERLLEVQRRRMLSIESRYELDRVRLIDGYRVQMRNLEHAAREAVRNLDLAHERTAAEARKILDALTGMRGG